MSSYFTMYIKLLYIFMFALWFVLHYMFLFLIACKFNLNVDIIVFFKANVSSQCFCTVICNCYCIIILSLFSLWLRALASKKGWVL